jgi:hypothetical protein
VSASGGPPTAEALRSQGQPRALRRLFSDLAPICRSLDCRTRAGTAYYASALGIRGIAAMGRRRKKKGIPGISFSWKRAVGVSAAKQKISRKTGIPLTKSGRQRKVGRALGCSVPLAFLLLGSFMLTVATNRLLVLLSA